MFTASKHERTLGHQFAAALFESGPAGAINSFKHQDPGRNTGKSDPGFTGRREGPCHGITVVAGQAIQLEDDAFRLLCLRE
ncbi:MAG TPA: hypothetical protein PKN30_00110 [Flavobacteriales bacterium]|nr:hypothetical protein [Flavobacteriales bacterium]